MPLGSLPYLNPAGGLGEHIYGYRKLSIAKTLAPRGFGSVHQRRRVR